jgi:hypothetical protein
MMKDEARRDRVCGPAVRVLATADAYEDVCLTALNSELTRYRGCDLWSDSSGAPH